MHLYRRWLQRFRQMSSTMQGLKGLPVLSSGFRGTKRDQFKQRSLNATHFAGIKQCKCMVNLKDFPLIVHCYESWVVPAGVPSALADIGGRVEANY